MGCGIGLGSLLDGRKMCTLGCGHIFHVDCYATWLREQQVIFFYSQKVYFHSVQIFYSLRCPECNTIQYCHPIFPHLDDEIQQFARIRQFFRNLHQIVHDYQDVIRSFHGIVDGNDNQEDIEADEENEGQQNEEAEEIVEEVAQNTASQ